MTSRKVIKDVCSPETRQRVFSSAILRELSHRPTLIEARGQRWAEGDAWVGVARAWMVQHLLLFERLKRWVEGMKVFLLDREGIKA